MDAITRRWTKTASDRQFVEAGGRFDLPAAERVRDFMHRFLRHSKGEFAGRPFELLGWQWQDFVAPFFGWRRPDGTRRYRRFSVWIPKKNGKSTLCAALVLYGLLGDGEGGPEVYTAAADRGQAAIIYNEVAQMLAQSPALAKYLRAVDTTKRVVCRDGGGFYAVLSKESKKTGHGINASECILDELHVVAREMYETLRYAGAARKQPIFGEISTAGNSRDSLGYERYLYAKRVRDGEAVDPELLPVIYEADSPEAWTDPQQWRKANPSLGVTISEASFAADFAEARQGSAAAQASFKQLRLNLWQDSVSTWFPIEVFDACARPIAEAQLVGRPCWGGLDLASRQDLAALVWVFQLDDGVYYLLPRFWCPEDADNARQRTNKALLRPWVLAGHIRATPGNVADYDEIERDILADVAKFRPRALAFDPWNAQHLITHLTAKTDGLELVEFAQTPANFNEPMKEFERLAKSGKLRHGGNAALRFCVKNVVVQRDANDNQRPHKGKSADKIDGVTASLMGLARALKGDDGDDWYTPGGLTN